MFAILIAVPRSAGGQEEEASPVVAYVEKGEPAPFAGDLYTIRESLLLDADLESCRTKAAADIKAVSKHAAVDLEFAEVSAIVKLESERARREIVERELEAVGAWYRAPVFVAIVAVAATLGAVTVVGYTWGQLARQ